jgi:predicted nucleotidyltransferase
VKAHNHSAVLIIPKKGLPYLRQRYGVERIAIFGSSACHRTREDSDTDIVVALSKPFGLPFIELAYYFEDKPGRKVDLVTKSVLNLGRNGPEYPLTIRDIQESSTYLP